MQNFLTVYQGAGDSQPVGTLATTPTGSRKRKSTVPERIPYLEGQLSQQDYPAHSQFSECKRPFLIEHSAVSKPILLQPFGLPCGVLGVISNNYTFGCQAETALDLSLKTRNQSASGQHPQPSSSQELLQQQQQQQQQQRQNFSSSQNDHLLRWFIEHRDRPYPGAEDTKALAMATNLTYSQVKKWFANKRMRSKGPSDLKAEDQGSPYCAKADYPSPVTHGNGSSSRASTVELDRSSEPLRVAIELP